MKARWFAVAAFVVGLLGSSTAQAQMYRDGPPPQHRLVYRDLSLVRLNPLGLITDARITYRYRLYESQSTALRDNFVAVGLTPMLSAGFARIGPTIEVQPASMLNLWAMYEFIQYFGTFNYLQSFPSAVANYSDTELKRLGSLDKSDPRKNYAGRGGQFMAGATLMLKVSQFVLRDQLRVARPDMTLRAGDRVFYDIFYDLLVTNRGWYFNNDADLLWQSDFGLTLGIRHTMARAFASDASFAPGDDRSKAVGLIQRAGPLGAYTWKQPDGARFEPTVLLVLNWWIQSPYRTGQDVNRAVPYLVAAFSMTGDLTPR